MAETLYAGSIGPTNRKSLRYYATYATFFTSDLCISLLEQVAVGRLLPLNKTSAAVAYRLRAKFHYDSWFEAGR